MNQTQPKVNLENFQLDFMNSTPGAHDGDDDRGTSQSEALEMMQELIPSSAEEIGEFRNEVDNWTSWQSDDRYYILPWEGDDFDWALFRISWDDNWGRYDWGSCARISGMDDSMEAAKVMLKGLFQSWKIDIDDPDNGYREFIDSIVDPESDENQ